MANLCFWVGILNKLKKEDLKIEGLSSIDFQNKSNDGIIKFINLLKNNNVKTENVLWQNQLLTKKELDENYNHVKDFDTSKINNGYDCSSCDPFILLITQLFKFEIEHKYCSNTISYKFEKNTKNTEDPKNPLNHSMRSDSKLVFYSNKSHFW